MIFRVFALLGRDGSAGARHGLLLATLSAAATGAGFAVLLPILRALLDGHPTRAWPWIAVLAALVLLAAAFHYLGVAANRDAGYALSTLLHQRLGEHLVTLPLGWFTARRVGLLGRLATQNVMGVMSVPAHLTEPLVQAFVTPAVVIVVMFFADWRLAVAATAAAPVIALAYRWTGKLVRQSEGATDAAAAEAAGRVVEYAQNQPLLRAHGQASEGLSTLDGALTALRRETRGMLRTTLPGLAGFTLTVQAAFTLLLILGTVFVLGGQVDLPATLAGLVLAVRATDPVLAAAELGAALRMSAGSLDRIEEVLATPALPEAAEHAGTVNGADIELSGVRFGYGDEPVLSAVSFRAPAGSVTALVGPSGAGKTTVLRLIARFFDVDAGHVRIGGADVRDLRTEDLIAQLTLVFQDVYLFDGTLFDNIAIGRPSASREEVLHAAGQARVSEIAARLPDGWDTRVGEGGSRLSGGERQRVSIARALLKQAPIVLLDEATAALDTENEAAVVQALTALTERRTVLVVAHRLSTVEEADQIVVLDSGRVAETGRHHELLAAGGRYAQFWRQRANAAGWRIADGNTTHYTEGASSCST